MPARSSAVSTGLSLRAVLFMFGAMALFSTMGGFIRLASAELHVFEIVFFRNLLAVALLAPFVWRTGGFRLASPRMDLHAARGVIGFFAMSAGFSAVTMIPLADATALSFTAPLFATLGAALALGERVGPRRGAAVAVGFLGAMAVLQPTGASIGLGSGLALLSAFLIAVSTLIVKRLTDTDQPAAIAFWMVLLQTPLSLFPALTVWSWPSAETLVWLTCLAAAGSGAHLCWTRAVAEAEVVQLQPFEFVRLPLSAAIGAALFAERPADAVFIGGALIVASSVYIARREARLRRAAIVNGPISGDAADRR